MIFHQSFHRAKEPFQVGLLCARYPRGGIPQMPPMQPPPGFVAPPGYKLVRIILECRSCKSPEEVQRSRKKDPYLPYLYIFVLQIWGWRKRKTIKLEGSSCAISKQIFGKYILILQNSLRLDTILPDLRISAPLQIQHFKKRRSYLQHVYKNS